MSAEESSISTNELLRGIVARLWQDGQLSQMPADQVCGGQVCYGKVPAGDDSKASNPSPPQQPQQHRPRLIGVGIFVINLDHKHVDDTPDGLDPDAWNPQAGGSGHADRGASPDSINALTTRTLVVATGGTDDPMLGARCAVCMEDFTAGAILTTLPCGHGFHQGCLLPWLKTNHTCPLCRATI